MDRAPWSGGNATNDWSSGAAATTSLSLRNPGPPLSSTFTLHHTFKSESSSTIHANVIEARSGFKPWRFFRDFGVLGALGILRFAVFLGFAVLRSKAFKVGVLVFRIFKVERDLENRASRVGFDGSRVSRVQGA